VSSLAYSFVVICRITFEDLAEVLLGFETVMSQNVSFRVETDVRAGGCRSIYPFVREELFVKSRRSVQRARNLLERGGGWNSFREGSWSCDTKDHSD